MMVTTMIQKYVNFAFLFNQKNYLLVMKITCLRARQMLHIKFNIGPVVLEKKTVTDNTRPSTTDANP